MVGLLLGPALGGLVAGFRLEAVFLAGSVICLLAVGLMLRLPSPKVRARETVEAPVQPWRLLWALLPVVALGAPTYWTFGIYDSVWSLYITSRGATTFLVGLSFATYALPIVLFSGLAGSLADRLGPVRAGTLALLTYGLLAATYPFIASVPALIAIGFLEGTLTAAGNPALMAEVSRAAPPGAQGRTQAVYALALNAAQVLGAVAGGALYGLRPAYAFLGATAVCLLGVASSLLIRRSRSAGAAA
jgi:MFS family permease